jgi:hypothetical protein
MMKQFLIGEWRGALRQRWALFVTLDDEIS